MTVNDLRETLTNLVALLAAADAKAATTRGLTEFVELTAPFGDMTLKAFASLAEAGRTPRGEAAGGRRVRPVAAAKADPAAVEAEVVDLYARAAESAVTAAQVEAACDRLGGLTKDALARLAERIELFGAKAMRKDALVAAITARVVERKDAAVRRTLIDRPPPGAGDSPLAAHTPVEDSSMS
ncbi:hypothetical protein J0H58_01310 [bacterium]|nr:hypothetical protein [bacterium]